MNKKLIALAVAAAVAAPMSVQAKPQVKWFGFAQMTMEKRDQDTPNDGLKFGGDRIRIGFKLKDGNVFGKLQIDFNKTDSGPSGVAIPQIIKDAEVGYKFSNAAKVKLGIFKTPIGMDFNTSGKKLDITKRGMEKKLVLERTTGIMLSGRKIGGGFGYDIFYGDPSGRSSAVNQGVRGTDNTTAIRVMYDMGKMLHVEASTGTSEYANGVDYDVTDVAVRYKSGPLTVKAEYITGSNVLHVQGRDETVWFLHGGYMLNKTTELVARYYSGKRDDTNTKLSNLFLGVNLFLGSTKTDGRLQINYVVTGGDDAGSSTPYNGLAGYRDNALLVQYQMSF